MSSRGAILFAFNSKYDYYAMAEYTAKRINHFLKLPVTLVTDIESKKSSTGYKFDKVITIKSEKDNLRGNQVWINKGRHQAYKLSPYDETLLLDVDYMVNSDKLLKCFDVYDEFCCHDNTAFCLFPESGQEVLGPYGFNVLWATAVVFRKSRKAKQIFDCIKMIQDNFQYYSGIHHYNSVTFRNDYALTLALRIVNGHIIPKQDIIPWNLLHVSRNVEIFANKNKKFNTEFSLSTITSHKGKTKTDYITIKDTDFHVMYKQNFMELMKNG